MDDTSFPQMGEEGCGGRNPTRSLLTFYNIDVFSLFLNEQGEKGKERRGRLWFFRA